MPKTPMPPRTAVALTLSLTLLPMGCADDEPDAIVVVDPSDLPCSGVNEAGIWESVPSDESCDWFEYEGKTTYEFPHSLGRVPALWLPYMSFSHDGSSAGAPGGNTFLLQELTEDYIVFRNATNQQFYLRLVLE